MSGRGGFRGGRGSSNHRGPLNARGGRGGFQPSGPPDTVQEMGSVMHACEGDIVCRSSNSRIPYFNAPIYLENKSIVGKVDEILGPLNQVFFTVKPHEGIVATSFKQGDRFYIGGDKLLPLERFLPKPKASPGIKVTKPSRGSGRGGRGVSRGTRGAARGGRGGLTPRGGRGGFTPSSGRGGFTPSGRGGFSSRSRGWSNPRSGRGGRGYG